MTSSATEAVMGDSGPRGDAHLTRRLWKYFLASPGQVTLSFMLYPLNALCVIVPPYVIQQILDKAISAHRPELLLPLTGVYLAALCLEYLTGFGSEYSMSVLGQRSMHTLRRDLFAHVQRLPASFFDRNPIGRILTRLTSDVEALSDVFASGAITIIADVLTVVAVVAMMLWLDVRLTAFAFLVVPPLVGLAAFFQRYARTAFRDIRKHVARLNTFLAEHISGMSVVQIFGQQARTQREFEQLNADYRDANRQAIFFDAALYAVVEAIGTSAVAALIWYSASDLAQGAITAGTLVAFFQYIRRFFVPIRDLSTKYTVLQSAFAAAERTFSLLDEPQHIVSAAEAKPLPRLQNALELRDVWFSYRGAVTGDKDWTLRGVNLTVRRGERVALVGSTGAGKSTVLKLLNRFYDVQRGAVLVDGLDARAYDLHQLRALFAVVLQDVHLFTGTLLQNLAFSDRISEAAARSAMAAVGGDAFVQRLPQGYDTPVQELGTNFSAGERQLLALARALALDPEVLILDEATSNIDSETEARIQSALDVLLQGRTAVVVAHRLSTIQKVDRILVFKHGQVVEEGDHATLMRRGGVYRTLVELQLGPDAAG